MPDEMGVVALMYANHVCGSLVCAGAKVKGRVLVCADGATSQLATKLGYCTEAPRGVCSRAFVTGGTHNAKFDGVCFYPKWSLPGYAALFRCAVAQWDGLQGSWAGWGLWSP
jgi:flavin-dependent dehydrogenase